MDFIGIKQDGKLFHPPAIAEQKRKHWDRIKEGAMVKSSLTVQRQDKSQNQLGAIWGLMMAQAVDELDSRGYDTSFILNIPKPTGIAIDKNALCLYFYNVCPIFRDAYKEGIWHGQSRITLSKADTKEAAKFFDDVRNFLASQWHIVVPEPDPNWNKPAASAI